MTGQQDASYEQVAFEKPQSDPVVFWLTFSIIFVVVVALVALLYVLLGGFLAPSTPRTLVESQLVLLRNAAKSEPGSGKARNAYILALGTTGQAREAEQEYQTALREIKGGELTWVYAAGATLRFDAKDYQKAIEVVKAGIASDDAARKALISSAKQNDAIVTDAQIDNTARISLLLTGGRAYEQSGDHKAALEKLDAAVKLDPEGADLLTVRAGIYAKLGEKQKAIADYKQALKFIPDFAPALAGLKAVGNK